MEITTHSPEETSDLGAALGRQLPNRAIVTLTGPLGSGKTTFIQGLVSSQSADLVSSPTFVYHVRYQMSDVGNRTGDGTATDRSRSQTTHPNSDLRPPTSGVIDHVDLYRVHHDPTLRTRSGIDELLTDLPGWLVIEWPLVDLAYPPGVPLVQIVASASPHFHFHLVANDETLLRALRQV